MFKGLMAVRCYNKNMCGDMVRTENGSDDVLAELICNWR
jgi:hypothetical protein